MFRFYIGFILSFCLNANSAENIITENVGGFIAGTIVHTFTGPDTIQNIKVGDRLLSFDLETGRIVESKVIDTHQEQIDELVRIVIAGEEFYVNPEHRFYVASTHEWVEAHNLQPGLHVLLNKSGQTLLIDKIEPIHGKSIIYDLTVENTKNYFVGNNQILVHNFAFIIPLFVWTIGEGIAILTAATLGALATTAAIFAIKELSRSDPGDLSNLRQSFRPRDRVDADRSRGSYPVDIYIRSRGSKLEPDPRAQADHTTFRPDNYETWRDKGQGRHPNDPHQWESTKRYRGTGKPHNGVEPPYINEGGKGRSARPDECMSNCNGG